MIKVLIVDDSALMRSLLQDMLSSEDDISVVGAAKNGEEGVQLAKELLPDIVIMDLDMPEKNGVEATKEIMSYVKKPVVVVFSGQTKSNATMVLKALEAGAISYIEKPADASPDKLTIAKDELITHIRLTASANPITIKQSIQKQPRELVFDEPKIANTDVFPIVVIGSSTGGPPMLQGILEQLSANTHAAIVVVQHMPPTFTASMSKRLNGICMMKVQEAKEGDILEPGTVTIAPGDYHLVIEKHFDGKPIIHLNQENAIHGLRPAIDITMKSLAEEFGERVTGIILTGMGNDGAEGMQHIQKNNGHTIVQSPETCVVDGMVQTTIGCDAADEILSPQNIASSIAQLSFTT